MKTRADLLPRAKPTVAPLPRPNAQSKSRVRELEAQLETLTQELESFRYSISHDLRAPLRHVLSYVEILQATASQTLDATSRQHLQTIAQAAAQMGQMMDGLLELSRIGRYGMRFQPVSLAALVEKVRQELRPEIKDRNIAWQIGDLPAVQGDSSLLLQAIRNLVANAVKYTRTRPAASIAIGTKNTARETVFFIRDNGIGFDNHCPDKLFGAFQRFHLLSEFEGVGIGLAKVRSIIRKHGGRTWADAKPRGGATFYFSIPKPRHDAK